jgi:hypothetical protein
MDNPKHTWPLSNLPCGVCHLPISGTMYTDAHDNNYHPACTENGKPLRKKPVEEIVDAAQDSV